MTREEQITYKAGCIADGCIAHGAPWKEYHQGFIEGAKWADANPSQPSLPSNLDEAAHEFEDKAMNDYDDIFVTEDGVERPVLKYNFTDAFKAGAEWMAGQFVWVGGEPTGWFRANDGSEYATGLDLKEPIKIPVDFYVRKK